MTNKMLTTTLFFTGFFGGLALGVFWGTSLAMRDVSLKISEIQAMQAVTQNDLSAVKTLLQTNSLK